MFEAIMQVLVSDFVVSLEYALREYVLRKKKAGLPDHFKAIFKRY